MTTIRNGIIITEVLDRVYVIKNYNLPMPVRSLTWPSILCISPHFPVSAF